MLISWTLSWEIYQIKCLLIRSTDPMHSVLTYDPRNLLPMEDVHDPFTSSRALPLLNEDDDAPLNNMSLKQLYHTLDVSVI